MLWRRSLDLIGEVSSRDISYLQVRFELVQWVSALGQLKAEFLVRIYGDDSILMDVFVNDILVLTTWRP